MLNFRCSIEHSTFNIEHYGCLRFANDASRTVVLALREALPSIDFHLYPRYRLHHYSDRACSRLVHH